MSAGHPDVYDHEVAVPIFTAKQRIVDYLTTSADKPYAFRNLFRISGNKLGIASATRLLEPTDPDESIFFASPTDQSIIEGFDIALTGSAYSSFDAALHAGRRWRQIAQTTLAREGISCDFGDDEDAKLSPPAITAPHVTGLWGLQPGEKLYEDRIGLLVFAAHPFPRFHFQYGGRPIVSKSPPSREAIAAARQRDSGDWFDELRLAYKLVHSAIADTNPETKFILWVTAVEALIPYRKKEGDLTKLLEALRPVVDGMQTFDEDTRKVVKDLLRSTQYQSIRKYGLRLAGRLVGEYDGKMPKDYFDAAYATRSALAHGNLRENLGDEELNARFAELKRFVLDILETWIANPSFGDDPNDV